MQSSPMTAVPTAARRRVGHLVSRLAWPARAHRSAAGTTPAASPRRQHRAAAARFAAFALAQIAATVFVASALAQGTTCDDFKATLAKRIEATGVRGYSLEVQPASARVPADAKVIGTCESGAFKVVYRRWGAARATGDSPGDGSVAAALSGGSAAAAPARRASGAAAEAAPKAVTAPPAALAPPATQSPATGAGPKPRAEPATGSALAARTAPAAAAASSTAAAAPPVAASPAASAARADSPDRAAAPPVAASRTPGPVAAGDAQAASAADSVAPPAAAVSDAVAAGADAALPSHAGDFLATNWRWIAALLALGLGAAGLWVWRSYLSPYDKDGLPRGPKL